MSHLRPALALMMLAAVGCTAEAAPADATGTEAITSSDGYRSLTPGSGAVYQSVAVVEDTAFVGDNLRRIELVDLRTMRKSGSLPGRIVNDSLTRAGKTVIACGLRDDAPLDPYGHTPADRSYVLTVIDADGRKVAGEIKLHIEPFLDTNPATGFVDLPDLSCRFDELTSRMTVTFAQHELGREVVTFPLPALGSSHDWRSIPGARRTRVDASGEATMKAAIETEAGITYAAGGWGLRRQAPGAARARSLRDESQEHLVDLAVRGDRIYAADNSGALVVTDLDGKTVERVEIPDFLHAVALTPSHVVVMGEKGLFVARDRWTP